MIIGALRHAGLFSILATIGCVGMPEAPTLSSSDRGLLAQVRSLEVTRRCDVPVMRDALAHPHPHVRAMAARALGRIQTQAAGALLVEFLDSGRGGQRATAEACFGLGQIGFSDAAPLLRRLATDGFPEVRARAVEALGRLPRAAEGTDAPAVNLDRDAVQLALADANAEVRGQACLSIWRSQWQMSYPAVAELAREDADFGVRWRATFALYRGGSAEGARLVRPLLADPNPWVCAFAAAAMANHPDPAVCHELLALLEATRSHWTARAMAALSLTALRQGVAADDDEIRDRIIERLYAEGHPLVKQRLVEALGAQCGSLEAPIFAALFRQVTMPSSVRRAALSAYGAALGESAIGELVDYLDDDSPWIRVSALAGLGRVGDAALESMIPQLSAPDIRVRAAAIEAVAGLSMVERWNFIRAALADPDFAVRGTAIAALAAGKPDGWVESLLQTYQASQSFDFWECRQSILEALKSETQWVRPLAESASQDAAASVRRKAREVLGQEISGPFPPFAELPFSLIEPGMTYGEENPRLVMETSRGRVVLELYRDDAPHHVANIIARVRSGFYDGLLFHRVVPAFVAQGGDPRGDGWGDGGYHLPEEINGIPFLRGMLGMPTSGKDSNGCQIFITHLPTPHLDGRYTVFGRVVLGMEVIDGIEVNDRILSVRVDEHQFRPASVATQLR